MRSSAAAAGTITTTATNSSKSSSSSSGVKNEKRVPDVTGVDDGEYDEWARGLVNRPIPQQGALAQQLTLSNVLGGTLSGPEGALPPHQGFDKDSAIGRFTWYTVESTDKSVPCLYRSGERYCCVRMIELTVIGDLLNVLPQEIYDAAKLNSHFITPAEAKLLTYIGSWHCDGAYGNAPFTIQDLVVSIPETERFYRYLLFAYEVLSSGGGNKHEDYSKCGFVRVNNESLIPYTVLSETEKGIPLFYFEGQTDILKEKARPLMGWELAYLKICCKVQGVRKDLISAESLLIVSLTDLKGYFPKRTVFTDKCWPPAKAKSLISKTAVTARASINNAMRSNTINTIQNRWTGAPSDNILRVGNGANNLSVSRVPSNAHSGSVSTNNGLVSVSNRNMSTFSGYNGTGQQHAQVYTNGYQSHQQQRNGPVPSTISIQGPRNQIIANKTMNAAKLKVNTPPVSMSGLSSIPEYADGHGNGAYSVKMIVIENEVVHCINAKPHKVDDHLLVLQEFITKFFHGVTIYPTVVSVLKSLGISTFLPNNGQIRALNSNGFGISRPWEVPLIPAKEAVQLMPRIRGLLTPKPTAPRLNQIPEVVNNSSNRGLSNGYYFPAGQTR